MRILAIALTLLAAPAAAQDVDLDPATVQSCMDGAERGRVSPACIGEAAEACQTAHAQPDSTLAISQCRVAEAEVWDGLLNEEYGTLREARADQADLLQEAQRKWIALRDADCDLAAAIYGEGSMRAIAVADCRLRHSAIRALQLRDMQPN